MKQIQAQLCDLAACANFCIVLLARPFVFIDREMPCRVEFVFRAHTSFDKRAAKLPSAFLVAKYVSFPDMFLLAVFSQGLVSGYSVFL